MEAMRPIGPQRIDEVAGNARPELTLVGGAETDKTWSTEGLPPESARWAPFVEDFANRLVTGQADAYLDLLSLIGPSRDDSVMPSSAALIECMASHPNPEVRAAAAAHLDVLPGAQDRRIFETAMQLFEDPELIGEGVEALLINPLALTRSGLDKIIAAGKTRLWERQQALIEEFTQLAGRKPTGRLESL